jgi:hypothetical protein
VGLFGREWRVYPQLEIKSGSPRKISGKGGTSGKHRRKKEVKEQNERKSADSPLLFLIGPLQWDIYNGMEQKFCFVFLGRVEWYFYSNPAEGNFFEEFLEELYESCEI